MTPFHNNRAKKRARREGGGGWYVYLPEREVLGVFFFGLELDRVADAAALARPVLAKRKDRTQTAQLDPVGARFMEEVLFRLWTCCVPRTSARSVHRLCNPTPLQEEFHDGIQDHINTSTTTL